MTALDSRSWSNVMPSSLIHASILDVTLPIDSPLSSWLGQSVYRKTRTLKLTSCRIGNLKAKQCIYYHFQRLKNFLLMLHWWRGVGATESFSSVRFSQDIISISISNILSRWWEGHVMREGCFHWAGWEFISFVMLGRRTDWVGYLDVTCNLIK